MADSGRDHGDSGRNDSAAKTLAIIALIVAVIALLWAIKANNRAGEALDKAQRNTISIPQGT